MAGIQVPELKRFDAVPDASVGRTNVTVPDAVKPEEEQAKAVTEAGDVALKVGQKYEADAADTVATQNELAYEQAWRKGMYGDPNNPDQIGIKYQDGNPTKLYKDFDDQMGETYKSIVGQDMSPLARDVTTKRLQSKMGSLDLQKLSEYGYQNQKFEENTTNAAVANEQTSLTDATAYIDPDDPHSFDQFDKAIGNIRNLRLRNGMKFNTVVPNEQGNSLYVGEDGNPMRVAVGPSTDRQLRQDLSDGIYNAMDNLVKAGSLEVATAMKEKYADYLEPVKKKQFEEDYKKADIKATAYDAADSTVGKSPAAIDAALKDLDPDERDYAYKIIDDRERRMQQISDRASKSAYQSIANRVISVQQGATPYTGSTELEADPVFKNAINRVTDPKQRQALYSMVTQPKNTPDATRQDMQDLIFGKVEGYPNGVRGMSPEDFALYTNGMSKSDQSKYTRRYEALNTQTNPQLNAQYKSAGKDLEDQLLDIGYIKKDQFGRILGSDQKKLIESRNDMMDQLDKNGSAPMSAPDLNKWVKSYAVSRKTGEAFAPIDQPKFQGATNGQQTQQAAPTAQPQDNTSLYKGKTRLGWAQDFQKKYGRWPDVKAGELQKYVNDQD